MLVFLAAGFLAALARRAVVVFLAAGFLRAVAAFVVVFLRAALTRCAGVALLAAGFFAVVLRTAEDLVTIIISLYDCSKIQFYKVL